MFNPVEFFWCFFLSKQLVFVLVKPSHTRSCISRKEKRILRKLLSQFKQIADRKEIRRNLINLSFQIQNKLNKIKLLQKYDFTKATRLS